MGLRMKYWKDGRGGRAGNNGVNKPAEMHATCCTNGTYSYHTSSGLDM